MKQMGVSILSEPNNGTTDGAFIAPSSIDALNQSRSDARMAYLERVLERPNLHVATQQMTTRILLEQSNTITTQQQTAVGVEVSPTDPALSSPPARGDANMKVACERGRYFKKCELYGGGNNGCGSHILADSPPDLRYRSSKCAQLAQRLCQSRSARSWREPPGPRHDPSDLPVCVSYIQIYHMDSD